MLYAARYEGAFPSRARELAWQRALGEKLLAHALQKERGLDLSRLARRRDEHGKPGFAGCPVHFSLSHTKGLVVCGLGDSPLGVDAEHPRPVGEALVRRACTPEELAWLASQPDRQAAFLSLWTLKESVMKLTGRGLSLGLKNAAFTFPGGRPRYAGAGEARLSQFSLPGGYAVAAASWAETFPAVEQVDLA